MIVRVSVKETEDGDRYCLYRELDENYRDVIWEFAYHRGETFIVEGEKACSLEAVIAYGNLTTPPPRIMA